MNLCFITHNYTGRHQKEINTTQRIARHSPCLVFDHKVVHWAATIMPGVEVEGDGSGGHLDETMDFGDLWLVALSACVQDVGGFASSNPDGGDCILVAVVYLWFIRRVLILPNYIDKQIDVKVLHT